MLAVVGDAVVVCPGPPTAAVNVGEKSRAPQLVVVKLACPVAVLPE